MGRAWMGWLIALACAVSSLAFLVLMVAGFLTSEVGLLDEPVSLVGGRMVRDGLVPHRDFWSMYPALDYYIVAGVLRWFGESVIVTRSLQVSLYLVVLACFAVYYRRSGRLAWAPVITATSAAILATGWTFTHYAWSATAAALIALMGAIVLARSASIAAWVGIGLVSATALLLKLNFGAYVTAAIAVSILVAHERARGERIRILAAFLAPVVAATIGYAIAYRAVLPDVLDQILWFPMQGLQPNRARSFTAGSEPLAVLILISAPFVWVFLRGVGRSSKRMRLGFGTLVLAILPVAAWAGLAHPGTLRLLSLPGAAALIALQLSPLRLRIDEFTVLFALTMFGHYFLSRADVTHYMPLVPFALLMVPLIAGRGLFVTRAAYYGAIALVIALAAAPTALPTARRFDLALEQASRNVAALGGAAALRRLGDPAAAASGAGPLVALLYRDDAERDAIAFVRSQTRPDEPVFVGLRRHASIFLSPTRAYWLLGRPAGVFHHMLEPGLSTEETVQRRMIDDLGARGVEWILLRENHPGDPDFEQRDYHGAIVLDEYLRATYEETRAFDRYSVYRRRPAGSKTGVDDSAGPRTKAEPSRD